VRAIAEVIVRAAEAELLERGIPGARELAEAILHRVESIRAAGDNRQPSTPAGRKVRSRGID